MLHLSSPLQPSNYTLPYYFESFKSLRTIFGPHSTLRSLVWLTGYLEASRGQNSDFAKSNIDATVSAPLFIVQRPQYQADGF